MRTGHPGGGRRTWPSDPGSRVTITGGDGDAFLDNCETATVDVHGRQHGHRRPHERPPGGVTLPDPPDEHPDHTTLPAPISRRASPTARARTARFDFTPAGHDLRPDDADPDRRHRGPARRPGPQPDRHRRPAWRPTPPPSPPAPTTSTPDLVGLDGHERARTPARHPARTARPSTCSSARRCSTTSATSSARPRSA